MVPRAFIRVFSRLTTCSPGLQLAKLADLPGDVLSEATRVTALMEEEHLVNKASSEAERVAQRRRVFLQVMIAFPGIKPRLLISAFFSAFISDSFGHN